MPGYFAFSRARKPVLALGRARRPFLVAEQQHLALALQQLAHPVGGQLAALDVVGGDERHDLLRMSRPESMTTVGMPARLASSTGRTSARSSSGAMHDARDVLADEALDDLHLLLAVVLAQRPLPGDGDRCARGVELALGLDGARVDGLPELVRRALRNHRRSTAASPPPPGLARTGHAVIATARREPARGKPLPRTRCAPRNPPQDPSGYYSLSAARCRPWRLGTYPLQDARHRRSRGFGIKSIVRASPPMPQDHAAAAALSRVRHRRRPAPTTSPSPRRAVEPGLSSTLRRRPRMVASPGRSRQGIGSRSVRFRRATSCCQYGQPIGTSRGIGEGDPITLQNMSNDVPVVRDLPADLRTPRARLLADADVPSLAGYRRADGRVGTRNFVLIVPTSMCASHESQQIATIAEFTLHKREKLPERRRRRRHPAQQGLRLLGRLEHRGDAADAVELRRPPERRRRDLHRPGLREDEPDGGREVPPEGASRSRQARRALRHPGDGRHAGRHRSRPARKSRRCCRVVNEAARTPTPDVRADPRREVRRIRRLLGPVGEPGARAAPPICSCARAAPSSITEVPEFCGAEHILAQRAKDRATGEAVYADGGLVQGYASKFGTVLNENPSPGNVAGGLLNITIKSLGAIAKAGTTRVEGVLRLRARCPRAGAVADAGARLRPGIDAGPRGGRRAGRRVHHRPRHDDRQRHRAGREAGVQHAVHQRMSRDLDLSAGGIIDGTETIDQVGARVFEHVRPRRLRRGAREGRGDQAPGVRNLGRAVGVALMRAAVLADVGRIEVRDVPVVPPGPARSAAPRRQPSASAAPTSTSSAGTATTTPTRAAARPALAVTPDSRSRVRRHRRRVRQRRRRPRPRRPRRRRPGPQLRQRRAGTALRVLRDRRLAPVRVLRASTASPACRARSPSSSRCRP